MGFLSGRINLQQWVQVTSTNASKTFGLYPQKGTLLPGSDADIVVFDPETSGVISANTLHENVDYTPYEGFKYQGYPVLTISGGRIIAKAGEFIGKHISGKFLPRKPFSLREE